MEFHELQQIVESNSRTIQAILDAQAEDRLEREEYRDGVDATIARLDTAIQRLTTLNEGVVNLLASLDEDRPTILRKLNNMDNKLDQILQRRQIDGGTV